MRGLWARWLLRDFRRRWHLVLAIASVIALGTGTYAALVSTSTWRTLSNDASFDQLDFHDVRVALTPGTTAREGELRQLLENLEVSGEVLGVEERLVAPTQVDIGGSLVAGRIVGSGSGTEALTVDKVYVEEGRAPSADERAVLLEYKFADAVDAPVQGRIQVSGGNAIDYTGLGYPPDDFVVSVGGAGFFLAAGAFASLYATLPLAQELAQAPGRVNELVLTVTDGTDVGDLRDDLTAALASAQPTLSGTVTLGPDEPAYRVLYDDIESDEQFWTVIALLMLVGATFAALNLTGRVVEGERREIGIGMALGRPLWTLAARPMALGVEIAVVGVLFGWVIGSLLRVPLRDLYVSLLPLPVWETPFVAGPFMRAGLFGVVLPLAAVAWPVWRAVRVEPVEAIRIGHLAGRGAGWAGLLRRVPLPGPSHWQMPVRNLLRTPRRTILTALGVAMAVAVTVTVSGLLDSFSATIDQAEAEVTSEAADRVTATLDGYRPLTDPVLAEIASVEGVAQVVPGLVVTTQGVGPDADIDLIVEVLDPAVAPWQPTVTEGSADGGLLLTAPAMRDLDVSVGDDVVVRHPQATGNGVRLVESVIPVAGTHPYPLRPVAYLDPASADVFGLSGATNQVTVLPEAGVETDALQRRLLGVSAIVGVSSPGGLADAFREAVGQFVDILGVVALVSIALALLIAFNAANISADERRRENATMLAYGLRSRTVLGMSMLESALIGVIGTVVALLLGALLLRWMVLVLVAETLPEIAVVVDVSSTTAAQAAVVGVLALIVAPLFTVRRLLRMDLPATLRVVE